METLTAAALPIPFVQSAEKYALPDPRVITCLLSPSVSKHRVKNQNLFPIDTQQFQPLSIKLYTDADDNESIPTPPLSAGATETPTSAKQFTSFQLDDETNAEIVEQALTVQTPTTEKANDDVLGNFSNQSPLHINSIPISSDILVSMLEREVEIRDLVKANKDFFSMIKSVILSRWEKFEQVLYMKRKELPDKEWMLQLSEFLAENPPLSMKFKDIVGYLSDIPSDDYYIDTLLIRDYPEILATLEKSFPEFFENAFQTFGQNHEKYTEFKRILFATRQEMCDEEWKITLFEILSRSQCLLGQFEDIIVCALAEFENM